MPRFINPEHQANKHEFTLDKPLNKEAKRHLGTCICGTRGTASFDSFCKGKFCRNLDCKYYQNEKRLDEIEMRIIAEERGCTVNALKLDTRNVESIITFTCSCGFKQTERWGIFYRPTIETDRWCRWFNCPKYHPDKWIRSDVAKNWIEFEGYTVPNDFKHVSDANSRDKNYYELKCPRGHAFRANMAMWMQNSRCKICVGDGRTLSYRELKNFYAQHGCTLLYTEEAYTGNVTKNHVPYKCPVGHVINNLTKNTFNIRINRGLGPCYKCTGKKRTEFGLEKDIEQRIKHRLVEHNCIFMSFEAPRMLIYKCSCGKYNKSFAKNILKETWGGCISCSHVRSAVTNMERYGVDNAAKCPELRMKQVASSFSKKEYTFPSGRKIFCQGYEPQALDFLLNEYHEDDIITDACKIPFFVYDSVTKPGFSAMYFPDMFIPKANIIVEVKSVWTMSKAKTNIYEQNNRKMQAVVNSGYTLMWFVYKNQRNLLYYEIRTKTCITRYQECNGNILVFIDDFVNPYRS